MQPPLPELRSTLLDPGERTGDVGVENGEGGALVLTDRRVQRGARDDRQVGIALGDRGDRLVLVAPGCGTTRGRRRRVASTLCSSIEPLGLPRTTSASVEWGRRPGRCGRSARRPRRCAVRARRSRVVESATRPRRGPAAGAKGTISSKPLVVIRPDAPPGARGQHVGHRRGAEPKRPTVGRTDRAPRPPVGPRARTA